MLPQNKYSFCQKVQLIWWLIRTKLLCRKARLIRFPFDLRGGGENYRSWKIAYNRCRLPNRGISDR